MEKRKWPWKKKSSERSGGESESSESISSHSERFSDEQQEAMREAANDNTQSPEVTSKTTTADEEVKENVKSLTEKLSAALVNVSAKEDLVKQHAKVAEEAVVGWEKAENEVSALKQQLEAAVQQNLSLEVKNSHLDGALKECVRQLRQARDEQEKRISDALMEKSREWESTRAEFEQRILDLQAEAEAARAENSACVDPHTLFILETLEKENSSLKQELASCCKELQVVTIERELSTQAAETASKLQLESIKKVVKLEAECRRLQSIARKSSPLSSHKSVDASSFHAESLTETGERLHAVDINSCKASSTEANGSELGCLDTKSLVSHSLEIDMLDDFLEMERLAAMPETKSNAPFAAPESASGEPSLDNPLRVELDSMTRRVADLENVLEKTEAERLELQNALDKTIDSLKAAQSRIEDAEIRLEEMQNELIAVYEIKESLEFQLSTTEVESRTLSSSVDSLKSEIEDQRKLSAELTKKCEGLENELTSTIQESELRHIRLEEMHNELTTVYEAKESLEFQLDTMEVESRTLSSSVDSLKAEIENERKLSRELTKKCQELENELTKTIQESELQQSMHSNSELKVKQEDLAIAADKLAECQKTIASLGMQLQSLATLEDFFIDTSNIPGFSKDPLRSDTAEEVHRLPSNGTFVPNCDSGYPGISVESYSHLPNGNKDSSISSSSSPSSTNHVTATKNWNSFGKFFSRSKSVVEHENGQE
ncbi:hypothetical protein C2S53_014992 [Perilla frutescens var. hirtella]|uniref:Filament-like plant protein n=1 Tax=Perilla frutescens var. hirtella TaxID=608512 RepID=A0AAD4PDI1_PERFH|nr:hypothetical protein C2S53_014992 [Perilla frutescens var. hirtella]